MNIMDHAHHDRSNDQYKYDYTGGFTRIYNIKIKGN